MCCCDLPFHYHYCPYGLTPAFCLGSLLLLYDASVVPATAAQLAQKGLNIAQIQGAPGLTHRAPQRFRHPDHRLPHLLQQQDLDNREPDPPLPRWAGSPLQASQRVLEQLPIVLPEQLRLPAHQPRPSQPGPHTLELQQLLPRVFPQQGGHRAGNRPPTTAK